MRRASLHTGATCWQQILTYTELLRTDKKTFAQYLPCALFMSRAACSVYVRDTAGDLPVNWPRLCLVQRSSV